jgi:hypothetical protein
MRTRPVQVMAPTGGRTMPLKHTASSFTVLKYAVPLLDTESNCTHLIYVISRNTGRFQVGLGIPGPIPSDPHCGLGPGAYGNSQGDSG